MMRLLPLCWLAACGPALTDALDAAEPWTPEAPSDEGAGSTWTVTPLAETGGRQITMAVRGDAMWAAWYAETNEVGGPCVDDGDSLHRDLFVASSDGDWQPELLTAVPTLGEPAGLALALDPSGVPWLAWAGGEPEPRWCGGHDAVVVSRQDGAWVTETAAEASDDAASGQPASDAGSVVGQWPALVVTHDGPALAYRDVHYGALQRDDAHRADAELAWRGDGAWQHAPVDIGQGAGERASMVVDPEGRLVIAHVVPVRAQGDDRQGVWVTRQEADGSWLRVQIMQGDSVDAPALAALPTGLAVLVHAPEDARPRLHQLSNEATFEDPAAWSTTVLGDPRFASGRAPALAAAPDGTLHAAWRRCRRIGDPGGACDPSVEAVVHAQAPDFVPSVALAADRGSCGNDIAIAAPGAVLIGARCEHFVDGVLVGQPLLIVRAP